MVAGELIMFTLPLSLDPHVPVLTIPIPLEDIRLLTLRPAKLLRLIAWEVLGCAGRVVREADSCELDWEASCDDLRPGTYNFMIAPGHNLGHVLNFADVYTQPIVSVSLRRHSTEPRVCDTPDGSPAVDSRDVVARRDGGSCIFSAFGNVTQAHIISKQTGMNDDYIQDLSSSRGFGFRHHRDPKNTLTLIDDLWDEYDVQEAFIVATDPNFLNDEDIPLPSEEKGFPSREQRKSPAKTSYIWQTLPRFHAPAGIARMAVAHNQRARFADPSLVEYLPSSAAINYIYVGALLKRYLPEGERLRIATSDRNRHVSGESLGVVEETKEKRFVDGQLAPGTAPPAASEQAQPSLPREASSGPGTVSA